jgi:hypothetical protein
MSPDPRAPAPDDVAIGARRHEVRFEPDPGQLVRLRATFRPETLPAPNPSGPKPWRPNRPPTAMTSAH